MKTRSWHRLPEGSSYEVRNKIHNEEAGNKYRYLIPAEMCSNADTVDGKLNNEWTTLGHVKVKWSKDPGYKNICHIYGWKRRH